MSNKKKDFSAIVRLFFQNRTNKILAIVFVLLSIIFFSVFKKAFIILFLILISWLTKFYQRYINVQIGVDLIMVSFICTAIVYGPWVGTFVGVSSLFLATLWSGRFTPSLFASFFVIMLFSFIAPAFAGLGITTAGIILTFLYDIVLVALYLGAFGGRIHRSAIFFVSHFFWNIGVFVSIAPKLMAIL